MNLRVNLFAIFVLSICSTCAHAQFDTVINLPENPDSPNPSGFSGNSIGNDSRISSDTQLNVFDEGSIGLRFEAGAEDVPSTNVEVNISGGMVGSNFDANSGSTVNISGGTVGNLFNASGGSTVNISGGEVGSIFTARSGSTVDISGGTFRDLFLASGTVNITGGIFGNEFNALSGSTVDISGGTFGELFFASSTVNITGGTFGSFSAPSGSTVSISGGEFLLNGNIIDDITSAFTLGGGDVFTGTLEDGSSFIFSTDSTDSLNGVNLIETSTPIVSTTPQTIDTASALRSARAGETLTVQIGGALGNNFTAVGATLNVESGSVGANAEVANAEVNVSGGQIGIAFDAFDGSTVNISGGTVGNSFDAFGGSTINISGGEVGRFFNARRGSTIDISGGAFEDFFFAFSGSMVNITGGTFGVFRAFDGSTVNISGGEFLLNGSTINDTTSPFTLGDGDVFTGTLEDGSSFIFSTANTDSLNGVNLIETSTPIVSTTPQTIDTVSALRSARAGETLTVQFGGALGNNFTAVGATLNVESGSVDSGAKVVNSEVNISGGGVGSDFDAFNGSTVNISGGEVGSDFEAFDDSTVNISGGTVGNSFDAFGGSTVNISGGEVGRFFNPHSGSTVDISGGTFGDTFFASSGSTVNIFAAEFFLNGSPIDASTLGEPITIFDRGEDVVLSGVFADGTLFDFDLNPNTPYNSSRDFFDPNSTLTITQVASSVLLGDVNLDEVVDFLDISPFIVVQATGGSQAEADINQDGSVDFLDIRPFIILLSQ